MFNPVKTINEGEQRANSSASWNCHHYRNSTSRKDLLHVQVLRSYMANISDQRLDMHSSKSLYILVIPDQYWKLIRQIIIFAISDTHRTLISLCPYFIGLWGYANMHLEKMDKIFHLVTSWVLAKIRVKTLTRETN